MVEKFNIPERIGGMIITPKVILNYVKDNPNWLFPFVLTSIIGLISGLCLINYMIRIKVPFSIFILLGCFFSFIGIIIFTFLIWLIQTSLIYGLVRINGKKGNFYPLFCAIGYSYIPTFIKFIIIGLFFSEEYFNYQFSSLLQFFIIDTDSLFYPLLSNIEFFFIWSLILCGLALNLIYKLSYKRIIIIIITYWLLVVLVQIFFLSISKLISTISYD